MQRANVTDVRSSVSRIMRRAHDRRMLIASQPSAIDPVEETTEDRMKRLMRAGERVDLSKTMFVY
jgi:hypothetical protein